MRGPIAKKLSEGQLRMTLDIDPPHTHTHRQAHTHAHIPKNENWTMFSRNLLRKSLI